MFGVVVCPGCGRAKGVELKQKTTTCACGFEIRVLPSRVLARAGTAREIAPLVGRANAQIAGGIDAYDRLASPPRRRRSRDVHARVIAEVPKAGDRATRIRAAAAELSKELELFTRDDWTKVMDGLGILEPEGALEALIRANAVFEPRTGFYRTIGVGVTA